MHAPEMVSGGYAFSMLLKTTDQPITLSLKDIIMGGTQIELSIAEARAELKLENYFVGSTEQGHAQLSSPEPRKACFHMPTVKELWSLKSGLPERIVKLTFKRWRPTTKELRRPLVGQVKVFDEDFQRWQELENEALGGSSGSCVISEDKMKEILKVLKMQEVRRKESRIEGHRSPASIIWILKCLSRSLGDLVDERSKLRTSLVKGGTVVGSHAGMRALGSSLDVKQRSRMNRQAVLDTMYCLTRREFVSVLMGGSGGLSMSRADIYKLYDIFDQDKDGLLDMYEILQAVDQILLAVHKGYEDIITWETKREIHNRTTYMRTDLDSNMKNLHDEGAQVDSHPLQREDLSCSEDGMDSPVREGQAASAGGGCQDDSLLSTTAGMSDSTYR